MSTKAVRLTKVGAEDIAEEEVAEGEELADLLKELFDQGPLPPSSTAAAADRAAELMATREPLTPSEFGRIYQRLSLAERLILSQTALRWRWERPT